MRKLFGALFLLALALIFAFVRSAAAQAPGADRPCPINPSPDRDPYFRDGCFTAIPHIALEGGWESVLSAVNNSPFLFEGKIIFMGDNGEEFVPIVQRGFLGAWAYITIKLPPGGKYEGVYETPGEAKWAKIVTVPTRPDAGGKDTLGIIFSVKFQFRNSNGVVVNGSSVEAMFPRTTFTFPCSRFKNEAQDSTDCGIAIANPNLQATTVTFMIRSMAGGKLGEFSLTVPPQGHVAKMLGEFIDTIPSLFRDWNGSVKAVATAPVAMTVLGTVGKLNDSGMPIIYNIPVGQ